MPSTHAPDPVETCTRPLFSIRLADCGEGACCRGIVTGYRFAVAQQDNVGTGLGRCCVGGWNEAAGRAAAIGAETDPERVVELSAAATRAWARGSITADEHVALVELAARRGDELAGRRAA